MHYIKNNIKNKKFIDKIICILNCRNKNKNALFVIKNLKIPMSYLQMNYVPINIALIVNCFIKLILILRHKS